MANISDRLSIEEHNGKKIIFVNYAGLKEKDMIELVNQHLELTLKTKLPFLADFTNTFATTGYMTAGKQFVEQTIGVIDKGAFLGVDKIKSYILKGILHFKKVNYKAFDTKEEAIQFLVEAKSVEKD